MSRSLPEWCGKNDDTPIPPRVKIRVFDRSDGCCASCHRSVGGRLRPIYDHIVALINKGENRESNLQLLCHECSGTKSAADVQEKSVIYRKRAKRLKVGKRHLIPGSKGSGFRKKMDGTVVREK